MRKTFCLACLFTSLNLEEEKFPAASFTFPTRSHESSNELRKDMIHNYKLSRAKA